MYNKDFLEHAKSYIDKNVTYDEIHEALSGDFDKFDKWVRKLGEEVYADYCYRAFYDFIVDAIEKGKRGEK